MKSRLVLFEDTRIGRLFPLALTRPVYDLRAGALTLGEKIARHFPDMAVTWQCRDYVQRVIAEEPAPRLIDLGDAERLLFVNGRVLMDEKLAGALRREPNELVFRALAGAGRDEIVAAWLAAERVASRAALIDLPLDGSFFEGVAEEGVDARVITYPWELVAANAAEIERDFAARMAGAGDDFAAVDLSPAAHLERRDRIQLGSARIDPGAVLDARSGPIIIGDGAEIGANAVIEGPAVIGARTLVRAGAYIYGGVTLGPVSKVGGEVSASIVQGFANKQHEGYLGNSYLGAWVNLGAGTHTSDLKNNYAPVRVTVDGQAVDTGLLHVGVFMGDHAKSAIGTLFNTGTVVGVAANVFTSGLTPHNIPSFSWHGPEGPAEHELERALITIRRVMERRDQDASVAYEAMIRTIYDLTAAERGELIA